MRAAKGAVAGAGLVAGWLRAEVDLDDQVAAVTSAGVEVHAAIVDQVCIEADKERRLRVDALDCNNCPLGGLALGASVHDRQPSLVLLCSARTERQGGST